MKLYLLSQDINDGWDTYDSCVVCAKSEEEARLIHPSEFVTHCDDKNWFGTHSNKENLGQEYITEDSFGTWVNRTEVDKINVEYIGEAKEGMKSGVICASFNAG